MADISPLNVLFLCTGNSARSILAESILNAVGAGRFKAYSAGSRPVGTVNPFALELLKKNRLPTSELRSKSWDEFTTSDAPEFDFVFTVCDDAKDEVCPTLPGQPLSAHWGLPDPAAVEGSDDVKRKAFFAAYNQLFRRLMIFASLPMERLDRAALKKHLEDIGTSSVQDQ